MSMYKIYFREDSGRLVLKARDVDEQNLLQRANLIAFPAQAFLAIGDLQIFDEDDNNVSHRWLPKAANKGIGI